MKLLKFKNSQDKDTWVNPDHIVLAKEASEKEIYIKTTDGTGLLVPKESFENAIKEDSKLDTLISVGNRLVRVLEQLPARIPTSMRMHY